MNRIIHYAWSFLLVVAVLLAPTTAEKITLAVACIVYTVLIRSTAASGILRLKREFMATALIAELVVFLTQLLTNLDITIARNYALLLLVALSPLGIEAEQVVLGRRKLQHSSESTSTAARYARQDAYTLLLVIGLSLIGTVWLHIPPALSAIQLLVITCIARPLLSGTGLQATLHKSSWQWRTVFGGTLVYGSFVFFFIRHYLEPRYADSINPVTWQATSVALTVFIACQAVLLLFNPRAPKILAYRAVGLLLSVLAITSLPFAHHYFKSQTLAAADWLWVIIGGLLFTALCLLEQWMANHNRQAVLALHRES